MSPTNRTLLPPRLRVFALRGLCGLAAFGCLVQARPALAEHVHTVARGQTLAAIARRYHVTVTALAAANQSSRDAMLREGQVLRVPARGEVFVAEGDTLSGLARRHGVSVIELARLNRLKPEAGVRAGQKLLLPGYEAAETQAAAEKRWGRPKRPGVASVMRLHPRTSRRVALVDTRGRVRRGAVTQMRELMRAKANKGRKDPHPRLLRLLAQISDHFGGRPLHIVSGYRPASGNTKETSRHVAGHAIDFRIPGVPLEALRDYCAKLDAVGVGLYPRSKFVHLDVRRANARWTDWSLPGQTAQLRKPSGVGSEGEAFDALEQAEPEAEGASDAPLDDGSAELSDELE